MLIVALVLAVIGLAALVTAVVTSNEIVAWLCIVASALGVVLLVIDAIRERQARKLGAGAPTEVIPAAGDVTAEEIAAREAEEDHPDEVVHDEPEYDTYSDDEPDFPEPAEQSAVHIVEESDTAEFDERPGEQSDEQSDGR